MEVILTSDVWDRMKAYVDLCPDEISGLGKIEKTSNGDFRIVDIAIFEQVVSPAHSDITAQALAKFQVELIKKGESMEHWNFWWHSHAKMSVFFSGTDTSTIDSSTEFKYMVSLVTNHKHEFEARVDVYEHARMYKTLEVSIEEAENEEVTKACQADIDAKVTRPTASGRKPIGKVNYSTRWPDDEEEERRVGYGGQGNLLPHSATLETIDDMEGLEEALSKVGTDDYAMAFDTYGQLVEDLEVEIDYYETQGDNGKLKEKKKELAKLKALGKEHGIDGYKLD